MDRHVALSKDEFACAAVDAVRTNDGISRCGRAVLEVEKYGAAFFFLDGLDTLVEVCAFSRHSFDEFVEEMSAVYASHAALSLLRADHLAFMLAMALIEKNRISNFQAICKVLFISCTRLHLRQCDLQRYRRAIPTCLGLRAFQKRPKHGVL